jgi:hypothetical protein
MSTLTDEQARRIAEQAVAAHLSHKLLAAEEGNGARLSARETRRNIAQADAALAALIEEAGQ